MNQQLLDTLVTILAPLLTALVGWLILALRQQAAVKTAVIKHEELRRWVTTLVTSAEQQFKDLGSNKAKLDYATEETKAFVQSLGLTLTEGQVRALIESAVRAMTAPLPTAGTVTIEVATTPVNTLEVTEGLPLPG